MIVSSYFPLIIRNSLRNRRRNALTIASVAVSLCLLGVLMAMYRALFYGQDRTPGQALRLISHHKVSLTQELPLSYERTIQQMPGVQAVTRLRWLGAAYKDSRDPKNHFAQFAIEPSQLFAVHPELTIPADQQRAFEQEKTACVASKALADKLGWKLGERITLADTRSPATLELTLAGIFNDPEQNEVLYFSSDYLRDSLSISDTRRDMVQQFHIEASSKDDVPRIAQAIDSAFANSPYPTATEPERAFQLSFVAFLGNLKLFLAAICGAITFTILLVLANTLSMSVRERTREVGVLKTLGFTSGEILGIFMGEAGLIGVAGGVMGCLMAVGLCGVVRNGPGQLQFFLRSLGVTPVIAVIVLATSVAIGFAGALVPALSASRTSIINSLRYTG